MNQLFKRAWSSAIRRMYALFAMSRLPAFSNMMKDLRRYSKHSSTFGKGGSRSKLQGLIIRQAHSVEVGMIYRPSRKGFAINTVKMLIDNLNRYLNQFSSDSLVVAVIETLHEYCNINKSLGLELPEIVEMTARLEEKAGVKLPNDLMPEALTYKPEKWFDFDRLACARRSCRDYSGKKLDGEILMDVVATATRSPSACNRQPCRVYNVVDPEKKKRALELQNNRSAWREEATILVITSELGMYNGMRERSAAYVDGGLFCMTLVYSLTARGIGACILNLNMAESVYEEMRQLLSVSESEVFVMMVACGYTPDEVLVPKKYHRASSEIFFER